MRKISTGSPFEDKIGFSRAIIKGDWCFISGVTGFEYDTMTMPDDVAQQTRNCLATIQGVLDEAGFNLADIVKMTYILTDPAHVDLVAPVLSARLDAVRPAATMFIAGLIRPEMKIEIDVTAFKG